MNPSAIREILKLTERPGIISLAGGLPSAETFPVEAMREATARVLRETPREALQYAASEGFAPLREWVAAEIGAPGPGRRRGAGADHQRLAAGPRSRRQGADRCRQPGRGRVADLPRRAAGVRSVRARVRDASRATTKGRCPTRSPRGAQGARFLYVLPNFQNPSGRSIGAARRAALAARRRGDRRADRRGQPVRRALVRRAAAAPIAEPLARRHGLPRQRSRRCSRRACASAT